MKFFLHLIGIFAFIGFSNTIFAQTGTLKGRILDDQRLALPGATVVLAQVSKGTITDAEGQFTLIKIPAGEYELTVSYMGYEGYKTQVKVEADQIMEVPKIVLGSNTVVGDEVVIMGDRLKGQAKALNEQRNNANITNIVAADQIGRFPDPNIGDALKRIPGISVLSDQGEARFGVFRGTEPRFNSVMVNGERVPSAESGSRTVQLDLIPSDMIQTIQVSKALTPDMDGDAIGGAANLVTRSAPSALRFSGTLGSGINALMPDKPILIGSLIAGKRFFNDKLGVIVSGSFLDNQFGSDNAEFVWDRNQAGQDYLTQAEIRQYLVQRVRRSVSASLDYKIGSHSTITFRSIFNLRDDYENRFRVTYSGMGVPTATGTTRGRFEAELKGGGEDQKFRRQERQTTTINTLSGDHLIANKIKLNWSLTYSYAEEDRPNERYMSFRSGTIDLRPNTSNQEFAFVNPVTPINYSTLPFRRFQVRNDFTNERDLNGQLHALIPLQTEGDFSNSLKVGLRYRDKAKKFDRKRGELRTATGATPAVRWDNVESSDYSKDNYLANGGDTKYLVGRFPIPQNLEGFEQKFGATNYVADLVGDAGSTYKAQEIITGGYAMLNQNLGKKAFLIAGVRFENTQMQYEAKEIRAGSTNFRDISRSSSYLNILPSLHFKYDLGENTILRAAWTNSLARPNYADLAPIRNIDQANNTIATGNPDLKATTAMNLDFMAEHYFKSIGLVSGGVFYKDIENYIYTYSLINFTDPIDGNTYIRATQPRNGGNAALYGFEIAFQRQLDFLPGFLKGLGVYANYTFNESTIKNFPDRPNETIALPGTAKHTWNGSLSYETKKLVVRVAANYRGALIDPEETIVGLSNGSQDFRYLDQALQIDANASYAFNSKWRIFVEAINLNNQPLRYYQGVRSRTMQSEYYNTRFQFGLKFDFFGE